jgi:ribonuclease R
LNELLDDFGFRIEYRERVTPRDVQRLLDRLRSHPLARVLSRQVLRSLTQARYSTDNAGHFGLAFPIYCHFTSPIRRYPDLVVHRQLRRVLAGEIERARADAASIERASVESSQAERQAMEAERAMLDLKKAEMMLDHLLEPEAGTIVALASFGFFVELDAYPIEGLVRLESIAGERYELFERERAIRAVRSGQRYRLGDRVLVEATNVSLRRREIDFALLERLPRTDGQPRRPTRPSVKSKTKGRRRAKRRASSG